MKIIKYLLIALAVIAVIFFGRGLLTPSVTYGSEVIVEKSAKEAWAVMSDESKISQWIQGYIKSELVSGEKNTVGAVSKIYVDDNGQEFVMQETITAVKPNELLAMTFSMDFMNMDYKMELEETGDGTKIRTTSTTTGNSLFAKSMVAFIQGSMKEQEDKNLNNLKRLIDDNTTDYFSAPVEEILVDTLEQD